MSSRPRKSDRLAGISESVGCVERLNRDAFGAVDLFEPSARVERADADRVVRTRRELLDAVASHADGAVVWVDDDIDMGGAEGVELENVTLASGYGTPSGPAATLRSEEKPGPMFRAGDNVRLTGLRLHGDEFDYFDPADRVPGVDKPIYKVGASSGVFVVGDDVELDNLELSGWTYAGVSVRREGRNDTRTHVHHVDAVDNPAGTLGYGVAVRHGHPLIEHCYFDNNRHSVTGTGHADCSYTLRFSVVGDYHSSHAIDMHGRDDDRYDSKIAGRRVSIRNNVVKLERSHLDGSPVSAVKIRGKPIEGGEIAHNWFRNPEGTPDNGRNDVAIRQLYCQQRGYENLTVVDNRFGPDHGPEDVGLGPGPVRVDGGGRYGPVSPDEAMPGDARRSEDGDTVARLLRSLFGR